MYENSTVLVIDDDADLRYSLKRVLSGTGYRVIEAGSGKDGIEIAQREKPTVILLDNRMEGMSGIETLQHLQHSNPESMVILMTAFGTTQTAIEAMKFGAFDYIIKPFDIERILRLVGKAVAVFQDLTRTHTNPPTQHINAEDYKEGIVGNSEPMQAVFKVVGQVAASDVTVMITGESGTGKELVARCIFQHSHRSTKRFIAVNCAAIPENLIESELFGHEKGSFTGATAQRIGKFELCDGGTIFLDEIGDMSLSTQTKILRALQEGEIQRVGGTETITANVRLIAATNMDLEKMVAEKRFREDLYYRLNVVRLRLPALRQRKEDISSLVDYMLQTLKQEHQTKAVNISPEALAILLQYDWPGNVRELENVIYRSAVVAQGETILHKDLPVEIQAPGGIGEASPEVAERAVPAPATGKGPAVDTEPPVRKVSCAATAAATEPHGDGRLGVPPKLSLQALEDQLYTEIRQGDALNILQEIEKAMIIRALRETGGNQVKTAAILGITRSTLRKRIDAWNLKY